MPFTYTKFSSKLPPLTLYWVLNSLLLFTPGNVIKMFSIPAFAPIIAFAFATSMLIIPSASFLLSFTTTSASFSVFKTRIGEKRIAFLLFAFVV